MNPSFDLEALDHFTAGAVGPPGERVFYLQARERGRLLTLKAEKEQVGALGEYLGGLLVRLGGAGPPVPGDSGLLEPVTPAWAIGAIAVGYDGARDRIIVEARELVEAEEEGATEPESATARFHLTRSQASAYVVRARALMKAGRLACPVCSQAIDPAGHLCPRRNGQPAGR